MVIPRRLFLCGLNFTFAQNRGQFGDEGCPGLDAEPAAGDGFPVQYLFRFAAFHDYRHVIVGAVVSYFEYFLGQVVDLHYFGTFVFFVKLVAFVVDPIGDGGVGQAEFFTDVPEADAGGGGAFADLFA